MRPPLRGLTALASGLVLIAGCSGGPDAREDAEREPSGSSSAETTGPTSGQSAGPTATPAPTTTPTAEPSSSSTGTTSPRTVRPVPPVSVLGLAQQRHRGDRLRLGAVRERTARYTSYDVTYRSRSTTPGGEESLRISGVLNVPRGPGPFPAVVLAHGYIDPAVYVRGQGMTRERGYLADRGYVALHVDYRNHAESDDDPRAALRMRLGYTADVINAVKALRAARLPVDDERVALFGRSMGGGVVLKALVAEPGLVRAAAPWASVSSLEGQNYDRFIRPDDGDADLRERLARRWGTPERSPRFWRQNSSRPYFDRITEPVLMVHGRRDDTCPPGWASATERALVRAGVDTRLVWYDDGHAFGPAFTAAMDRTVRFFDRQLA